MVERIVSEKRPSLRKWAPLVYYITLGFAVTNILIAASFFKGPTRTTPHVIVRGIFTLHFWGWIFILLAILGGGALVINHWKLVRRTLFLGLFVKALWLYALLLNKNIAGVGVWGFLAYVQLLVAIYFPEERKNAGNR